MCQNTRKLTDSTTFKNTVETFYRDCESYLAKSIALSNSIFKVYFIFITAYFGKLKTLLSSGISMSFRAECSDLSVFPRKLFSSDWDMTKCLSCFKPCFMMKTKIIFYLWSLDIRPQRDKLSDLFHRPRSKLQWQVTLNLYVGRVVYVERTMHFKERLFLQNNSTLYFCSVTSLYSDLKMYFYVGFILITTFLSTFFIIIFTCVGNRTGNFHWIVDCGINNRFLLWPFLCFGSFLQTLCYTRVEDILFYFVRLKITLFAD